MHLEPPQLPAPQHIDRHRAPDALGVEQPDQIVDAGDRLAVEPHDDVVGHQPGRLGRPVRLGRRDHGAEGVVDAGRARMPARHRHGLRRRRR